MARWEGPCDIALTAVSCAAAGTCTAVGSYVTSAGVLVPLAESWNGTAWRIQPVPSPAGATFSQLYGVSCTAATACTAVGNDTAGTLAESWNGTAWRVQATPSPAGATRVVLSSVSCAAATSCTAVGSYDVAGTAMPLAEGERAGAWTIEAVPLPKGELPSALSGVSCNAAGACTAAGFRGGPSGQVPLAAAWDDGTWAIQPVPVPSGAISSTLSGVSCPAAGTCTAAGYYVNRSPDYRTLAEAQR